MALTNTYSKRQELTTRSRTDNPPGLTSTVTAEYSYDDESRLTQAVTDTGGLLGTDTETFTLDGVGNRTAHNKILGSWDYDANNRLTEKGLLDKTTYAYDDAGSLSQKTRGGSSLNYGYDSQHRLVEVKDTSGNPIARYGYDPMDRRIWKEAYRNQDGAALSQPTRSYYLYSDEGLIAESQQSITHPLPVGEGWGEGQATTEPAITAQYGPRPNSQFGTGVLFVKAKNSNNTNTIAYYHHDHLGTPLQATDKQGNIVWSAQYNVFGQASITTPTPTFDKPTISSDLRFPGQVYDEETGLHYNWHRYYDPALGRYVTADPVGLQGGINTYAYVNGNPVNAVDPTGLIKLPTDPSGLPPNWNPDPSHRDPNGERWTNGTDVFDFHKGRPGMPGWRGKDHWHHNGGDDHLEPGDQCPTSDDPPVVNIPDQNFQIEPPPLPWWVIFLIPFPGNPVYGGF